MVVLGNRPSSDERGEVSYLYCQFPVDFFIEREQKLPALVQRWCEKLKPEHGYSGFWLGRSYGYEKSDEAVILEYKFGQRFPGMQINKFTTHSLNLHRGPKGVDWLTILSDAWLERLGDLEQVKEQMGELPVLEYSGGAILRAGAMPQLGDNESPRSMPPWPTIAVWRKLLNPFVSKTIKAFIPSSLAMRGTKSALMRLNTKPG
ncbi:type VI immunity family protein [Halomonas sp. PA16-9]|uniref:type VI immunity family protein n=1 Tax=Halomonas sp. PA16-9 TaxID=2576841 RepID=UPI0012DA3BDA|nr:DUF3396 domain-containing protein [Halomonas sp. PA16-9]